MSLRPDPKRRLPRAALILAAAIVAVLAQTVAACQPPAPDPTATPSPFPPPSPPPFSAPAPADTSAVPAMPTPTSTPDTAAPTATVPTLTPTTIPAALAPPSPPALPTPTPTPSPAPVAVPYTDGPVSAAIMPSRDHFPRARRIAEIVPGGYSTIPPTSGRHWDAWAACGFYDYALPDELLVHNLEHGNIIVSYNLPDAAQVQQLRAFMDNFELAAAWAVTRHYDQIPANTVALSAWGVLDTMQGVDEPRIERFFREYAGTLGPEFPNGAPCTASGVTESP